MSEHHPITDQMLAEKNATGHSIFGPSSAHRWMRCPRSLIAGHLAGDRPTFYAAEGSVAHWLAEGWLTAGSTWVYSHLGSIQSKDGFDIEITDEMISYVEEYVELCSTQQVDKMFVEVKVDLSEYTPVPSFGTSDWIGIQWQKLKVKDLKYGKIWVDPEENEQGLAYALGAFNLYDWMYDFQEIEIQVCQPRKDNFGVWTIGRQELLDFGERYREAAHLAWDADAPYNPDPIACEYCPARFTCPALAAVNLKIAQGKFDDLDDLEMTSAQAVAVIEQEIISTPNLPPYAEVPVHHLAKVYEWRSIFENYFRGMYDYLLHRLEMDVEVPGQKLGLGRAGNRKWIDEEGAVKELLKWGFDESDLYVKKTLSPSQASTLLRTSLGGTKKANDARISGFVYQPPGKLTMIPSDDKREGIASAVSAFDDDVEAIGNS